MSWILLKQSWTQNFLVSSFVVCFFPPKCIPESRNVGWSGGEEWNSGKVGCIMEMTTSTGSWSLSPQGQSLTKRTQNRSLEDLSMDIHLPFHEVGSKGSWFLCTCICPQVAIMWNGWHLHRPGGSGSCRNGYLGQDFFNWPTIKV